MMSISGPGIILCIAQLITQTAVPNIWNERIVWRYLLESSYASLHMLIVKRLALL